MAAQNARLLDPETSHDAGLQHERSGHAEAHRIRCEMAVFRNTGMTAKTIAKLAGVERHEASRRLPELRADGKVRHCLDCERGWEICSPKLCLITPEKVNGEMRWFYTRNKKMLFRG